MIILVYCIVSLYNCMMCLSCLPALLNISQYFFGMI